ncbi:TlpA family protein disulfide reductase [Brumimicrobium oceani]|uniref:Thioredoxin domain-containing protein n=1 Tax=Brumimicrobium oceani TaxID=2100725 RepID=A0A2U2XFN4_9FLAO|nr:TlpA disulfide reductase family protein [Brumimicrobium oceani]PWH86604.1 hypothetical protein DIT68_05050 [Brumimicrobium oceani]
MRIAKNKIFFFITILLLGIQNITQAQDSLFIKFNNGYYHASDNSHGFMKLLQCSSDGTVTHYGKVQKVIYPENFNIKDSALAFNYFTGWKNSITVKSTPFLFGNYKSYKPIVYVDYNHNLDFSDDGQPLIFDEDSTLVVYLSNSENSNAQFPIKFFYPKLTTESKAQIASIITNSGPDALGNTALNIDYWLADKRMNYRVTETLINGEEVKIGLYDNNCNGLYNDLGKDRIVIGDYENDLIFGELDKGAVEYNSTTQIEVGGGIYEIQEIEATGKHIILKRSQKEFNRPLGIGDNISHFEIELINGQKKTVKEIQESEKYLLLDFWGTWCKGCTQQLPDLKELVKSNSENVQVLGLIVNDKIENVNKYIEKHNLKWQQGFSNEEIIEKLRIDGFPTYLLLDNEGKILMMNGEIEEIKKIIK